jgi:hypothetical protein
VSIGDGMDVEGAPLRVYHFQIAESNIMGGRSELVDQGCGPPGSDGGRGSNLVLCVETGARGSRVTGVTGLGRRPGFGILELQLPDIR